MYNLRHESGISRQHAVRKSLLVSFHISLISRWGSTYGIYNKEKPFYLFITGCLIVAPIRYRTGFLRQRRESSTGTFPFHRPASRPLVYAQRCFTGTPGITPVFHYDHHIHRNRSSHLGISHSIDPAPITHPVFRLLETSLKPEPFYGYIAVIFPVCLNTLLRFKNCDKVALWESRTFLFYFSILGAALIITALLFKTDQPVWMAAILSGIWVCWMKMIGWKQTKEAIQKHIQLFAISSIILFVIIAAIILIGNIQKAQAGDRRLLIWNITTQAIMEHPVTGTGIGGFPTTYAKGQSAYFETDTASSKEKQTATCPRYAYNEYLQIGLELGITGLLLFIFWLAFSLYYGIRHRQIGASGGILALGIFALYSYPLQLPTYWVLLLFLTVICVTIRSTTSNGHRGASRISAPSLPPSPAFFSMDRKIPTIAIRNGRRFRNYITIRHTNKQPAGIPTCLSSYTTGQISYTKEQNVSIRPGSTILPSSGWTGL